MKAMVLHGDYDVRYEEVATPKPGFGQILIKVLCAGLCATDISFYTGENSFKTQGLVRYPMIQGHEWVGIVEEMGEGVDDLKIGDRVIGDSVVTCGHCPECLSGSYVQCEHQRSVGTVNAWDGAFGDYIMMPERSVYKVPETVSDKQAVLVEPLAIGVYAAERAEIHFGDTVVIYGTGAVGFGALIGAINSGAVKTIFVGRQDKKLEIGRRFGADHCINATKQDAYAEVMRLTNGKGADVVVEATGASSVFNTCLAMTKSSGVLALPAFYEKKLDGFYIDDLVLRNIKLVGASAAPNIASRVLKLLSTGRFPVEQLITEEYLMEQLAQAYDAAMHKRENIKILLNNT